MSTPLAMFLDGLENLYSMELHLKNHECLGPHLVQGAMTHLKAEALVSSCLAIQLKDVLHKASYTILNGLTPLQYRVGHMNGLKPIGILLSISSVQISLLRSQPQLVSLCLGAIDNKRRAITHPIARKAIFTMSVKKA